MLSIIFRILILEPIVSKSQDLANQFTASTLASCKKFNVLIGLDWIALEYGVSDKVTVVFKHKLLRTGVYI